MSNRGGLLTAMKAGLLRPAIDLDLMSSNVLDARMSLTRASTTARYRGSNGLMVVSTSANEPRFDYNYKVGGSVTKAGLLLEVSRTNICLQSRTLTNASWTKSASMTAAKDQTGDDGVGNAACRLTAAAADQTCLQAVVSGSAAHTFSATVRRLVGSGAVEMTIDNGTTWVPITLISTFARFAVTQTLANPTVGFRVRTNTDAIAVDDCQLEVGSEATSPITTTTGSAGRNTDVASITGANFTALYVPGVGGIVSEFMLPTANQGATRSSFAISDNTNNEAFQMYLDAGGGTPSLRIVDGGANQTTFTGSAPAIDVVHKHAMSWNFATPRADGAINGAAAGSSPDVALTQPTVDRMIIGGQGSATALLNGWLRRVRYYRTKLNPQQLAMLTA